MSKRLLVDTNLIIRFLVQDNEKHARVAERLFTRSDRGEVTLILLPVVLAECVFVLESFYQHSRPDIADVLDSLIFSPGINLADADLYADALRRYAASKLHFVDCILAAQAVSTDMPIATFDSDFRKIAGVRVELQ